MKYAFGTFVKKMTAGILTLILAVNLLPGTLSEQLGILQEAEAAITLKNPVVETDTSMAAGQKVTYDCVWFGSYPQTEIVDKAERCGTYGKGFAAEGDYEVNSSLYSSLQRTDWNGNSYVTIAGTKYIRIKKAEAMDFDDTAENYKWDSADQYHYFRCDPIKWRVLKTTDAEATLLADQALDIQYYNTEETGITWSKSTVRSWLNSYDDTKNSQNISYKNKGFLYNAFSETEKAAIKSTGVVNNANSHGVSGGNDCADSLFLLSEQEVYGTETAESFGFVTNGDTADEARRIKSSTFAKAMGVRSDTDSVESKKGTCAWWLRSPGESSLFAGFVGKIGGVDLDGLLVDNLYAIRPALNLKLDSDSWAYAGTVCTKGTKTEQCPGHIWDKGTVTKAATCAEKGLMTYTCTRKGCNATKTEEIAPTGKHSYVISINGTTKTYSCYICGESYSETISDESNTILKNPDIVPDTNPFSKQKVTWDCVWFGSYPQTEIVDEPSRSGTYGKAFAEDGDYEVDSDLYETLCNASDSEWSDTGDITIAGVKYRRMLSKDATVCKYGSEYYYEWDSSYDYHYFRYDPIKWRVLNVSGDTALLLADKALNDQQYHSQEIAMTWEDSNIRSWLNNYTFSKNSQGFVDYSKTGFKNIAFTNTEQTAIRYTDLENADGTWGNTEGGANTTDEIFLLSESEVYDTDKACSYGFLRAGYYNYIGAPTFIDPGRKAKSSTYAKAMGVRSENSCCNWWLRSPGGSSDYAADINGYGEVNRHGYEVNFDFIAVRPALNLDINSNHWKYAGTVSSDGTVKEHGLKHSWDKGTVTTQPTCGKKGVMTYTCTGGGCSATRTEDIPPTGKHNYKSSISGKTKTYKCSVCGSSYKVELPNDSAEAKENDIINKKTDSDVSGAEYGKTCARIGSIATTSITIKWNGVSGATGYRIYASQCNHGGTIHHLEFKKIAGKATRSFKYTKLKKGTMYKFLVMAVKGDKVLSTSPTIHIATTGGKYTNAKSMTMNVKSVSVKKGKTQALKVKKTTKYNSKLTLAKHRAVKYETSNKKIATVSAKGVVKGVKKGSCYVYVYAQDGVYKKLKVTVK